LDPNTILAWIIWLIVEPLIAIFSFSDEESGQRYLFQSTSAAFGGRGTAWRGQVGVNSHGEKENGLFIVTRKCDCTLNSKTVGVLRETAQKRVVDHTQEVLAPFLQG
jgi:hypothetical protein